MYAKCRCCGNALNTKTAFKIKVGSKNEYYCNEEEYNIKQEINNKRKDVVSLVEEIAGKDISYPALNQELDAWLEISTFDNINGYLRDNNDYIQRALNKKSFDSGWGKVRYLSAIVKNHISFYNPAEERANKEVEFDGLEYKYKRKHTRKPMTEYESEETNG